MCGNSFGGGRAAVADARHRVLRRVDDGVAAIDVDPVRGVAADRVGGVLRLFKASDSR